MEGRGGKEPLLRPDTWSIDCWSEGWSSHPVRHQDMPRTLVSRLRNVDHLGNRTTMLCLTGAAAVGELDVGRWNRTALLYSPVSDATPVAALLSHLSGSDGDYCSWV